MDEGGKQLGAVVIAVVAAVALIAIATELFKDGGLIDEAFDDQIEALTSYTADVAATV